MTANQGEDGILELCELLIARGIGIEAGLLSGPVWRTSRFCPTAAWPTATAISLRLPPRCSPTARLNKSSSDQASSDGVGTASCIGSAGSDVPVRWLASLYVTSVHRPAPPGRRSWRQ